MGKRIRILYTISNFNTAGSGKVIFDLVNHLDKENFDIEIACGSSEGYFFNTVENLGVPIRIFETKTTYKPYSTLIFRLWTIARFYRKYRYDMVHSWQWSSDWTEALAAKLAGVKWIYTKKAMGFESKHWKIKSFFANYIITINNDMDYYFPHKKTQKLIPLGLDTDFFNPDLFGNDPSLNTSKFKIITVANLAAVKGIEVLLQAISLLQDHTIDLVILGENSNDYGMSMKSLSLSLGLENQVSFIDKESDVRPFLASSNLFVIPTLNQGRKEGMPMALVEAMSMGIPVIGSDISGINFVMKDFRELLFQAGNFEQLAEKILEIQRSSVEKRQEMGKELREYCVSNFSIDSFIKAHERLYSNIV